MSEELYKIAEQKFAEQQFVKIVEQLKDHVLFQDSIIGMASQISNNVDKKFFMDPVKIDLIVESFEKVQELFEKSGVDIEKVLTNSPLNYMGGMLITKEEFDFMIRDLKEKSIKLKHKTFPNLRDESYHIRSTKGMHEEFNENAKKLQEHLQLSHLFHNLNNAITTNGSEAEQLDFVVKNLEEIKNVIHEAGKDMKSIDFTFDNKKITSNEDYDNMINEIKKKECKIKDSNRRNIQGF